MDEKKRKLLLLLIGFNVQDEISKEEESKRRLDDLHALHQEPIPDSAHAQFSFPAVSSLTSSLFSIPDLQVVFSDPSHFFKITHLTRLEFVYLHDSLKEHIQLARARRDSGPHVASHITRTKLTSAEQLLLWMMAIEDTHPPLLGVWFKDVDVSTIFRIVDHVTDAVNTVLDENLRWPTLEQRKRLYGLFSVDDKVVAIMDGTHCEIDKPVEASIEFWSGHKKKHTQNYLVWVDALGMVIRVEGPYQGRYNDRGCYNNTYFASHLSEFVENDEIVIGDGGFIGGENLLCPWSAKEVAQEQNVEMREHMYDRNLEIRENRKLVEDVIGWVKATARVLGMRFQRAKERQPGIFVAACKWWNTRKQIRITFALQREL